MLDGGIFADEPENQAAIPRAPVEAVLPKNNYRSEGRALAFALGVFGGYI